MNDKPDYDSLASKDHGEAKAASDTPRAADIQKGFASLLASSTKEKVAAWNWLQAEALRGQGNRHAAILLTEISAAQDLRKRDTEYWKRKYDATKAENEILKGTMTQRANGYAEVVVGMQAKLAEAENCVSLLKNIATQARHRGSNFLDVEDMRAIDAAIDAAKEKP